MAAAHAILNPAVGLKDLNNLAAVVDLGHLGSPLYAYIFAHDAGGFQGDMRRNLRIYFPRYTEVIPTGVSN
jgi:hypothetical protein